MFAYIAYVLTYNVFGLESGTALSDSVYFFFYDVFKILFLIFFVVSFISFLRTFFESSKIRKSMSKVRFGLGNLMASVFGAVTPFCSCSSIPLFIGFIKARVPAGVAFSFLITSPLVNEVAFVIMGEYFGWKLAAAYAITGIVLGVLGGLILGAMKVDKEFILEKSMMSAESDPVFRDFDARFRYAAKEGFVTFKKLFFYVVAGVALGAVIHGYVPQEFFINTIGKYGVFAVPAAVLLGVPIYAGCSTIAPLIFTITANGIPIGTSLAFMMSIAGLSLPEAIMLKRIMSIKLLVIFFSLVTVGIIFVGYLFNFLESYM